MQYIGKGEMEEKEEGGGREVWEGGREAGVGEWREGSVGRWEGGRCGKVGGRCGKVGGRKERMEESSRRKDGGREMRILVMDGWKGSRMEVLVE